MPRCLSSATAAKELELELGPGGWGGGCSDPVKGSTAEKRDLTILLPAYCRESRTTGNNNHYWPSLQAYGYSI